MGNIERCWVCTRPEPESTQAPVVMYDEASADWYRGHGWAVVEFVPSTDTRGAVEWFGFAMRYMPCHDHLMNWNYPLGDDGPDGSDGAGFEYVRSLLGGSRYRPPLTSGPRF